MTDMWILTFLVPVFGAIAAKNFANGRASLIYSDYIKQENSRAFWIASIINFLAFSYGMYLVVQFLIKRFWA
ncbi:hypothetical protein GRI58_13340 [Porphyrobacter algicida]|uniref:Uncharacterized protein n=1 Tax=Qipengyuania algicida TaxID=1836209 RepID=A0A845AKU8_9SPHN|nr:hypothetical protein [Qipengyuania algicida]MXP29793.1 hypothetical protein [Qipengyuania algicida]